MTVKAASVGEGSQMPDNEARRALNRSRAVDLIVRTLTFTDWARLSDDEVESVANRLLTQIEELTK